MKKRTLKQAEEKISELEERLIEGESNFYTLKREMDLVRYNKEYSEKILKNQDRNHMDCVIQNIILITLVAVIVLSLI